MKQFFVYSIGIIVAIVVVKTIPIALCSKGATKWMNGDLVAQRSLASGVERLVFEKELSRSAFRTGSNQFNGEWLFGTYLMAGIGFGQMALEHPELRERCSLLMERCIEKILSKEVRAFDMGMWDEDPLESLDGSNAHAAYLGYLNLLLGMHRLVSGKTVYADINDRITKTLIKRVSGSPALLIESYPDELYPVDNCFVIGSIGMHQRVTNSDHSKVIQYWVKEVRTRYLDPRTGLLVQAVDMSGNVCDAPRGSGTALGLFAVHHADPELARDLYSGIKRSIARTWLGFGAVREYPDGVDEMMDIDSGPIIFGYGFSATGFTIAGARMCGDEEYFERLFATANLCGVPVRDEGSWKYLSGGPLGNSILFAMLTAPKIGLSVKGGSAQ